MAFIRELFKKLKINDYDSKKSYVYINKNDPMDSYNVIGEIGDGAFGKVFKAENKKDNVLAALKQVNLEEDGDLEEYIVEIEILTECKHSNIVNLYSAYHFENKLWMALEYCNGGALDSLMISLDKGLNEKAIRYTTKEVLSGLIFLHAHGVIHRDLKAGNILVTKDAEVKLADFGVSAKLSSEKQKRNTFQGTPYWMAPEVIACQNLESFYDCKADIWSLGITLIELAQMRPPYHQMQPTRVLLKIAKGDPPGLDKPHSWSTDFNSFLKRCLNKDQEQRPYGTDLATDRFITTCLEADKRALKVLIYEANAESIEEIVVDLNLKNMSHSLSPSQPFEDTIEKHNSVFISETGRSSHMKTFKLTTASEILDRVINDQLRSEEDKLSILGAVCDVMEANSSSSDVEDSICQTNKSTLKNQKESFYKTLTKTRKFMVDDEEITTTTTKVVREGFENKNRDQIQERKLEIRELQWLGKEESRQKRQLHVKSLFDRNSLFEKHKAEELNLEKSHELEIENILKIHKSKLDKMEIQNNTNINNLQKKLISEKTKKETEFKLDFNKELEKMLKNIGKDSLKKVKDSQNQIYQEKFKIFQDGLIKDIGEKIEIMTNNNRVKICELELNLLKEKHQKLNKYNKEKSKLVVGQFQAQYQLETQHKKEMFMLIRQQLKHRQDKEFEHLDKNNKKELEELECIQNNEKRTFPKFIKNVSQTRYNQKKRELEIQLKRNEITNSEMRSTLKKFEESEKEREKSDMKRMELKLFRKREEMLVEHTQRKHELDQLHAEKRKELTDEENIFLREVEKKHREQIFDITKKSEENEVMEEKICQSQKEKLRLFYNVDKSSFDKMNHYSSNVVDEKKYVEALC